VDTRSITLASILFILIMGSTSTVYGQIVEPIVVTTDKTSYSEGEAIIVTGEVSQILFGYAISLIVIAPNGEVIQLDQLVVDRYSKFQTVLSAGGSLYDEAGTGTYTIKVLYATENRTAETSFQYFISGPTLQLLQEQLLDLRQEFLVATEIDQKKLLVNSLNEVVKRIQELPYTKSSQLDTASPLDRVKNNPLAIKIINEMESQKISIGTFVTQKNIVSSDVVRPYEIDVIGDVNCKSKNYQALDLLKNKAEIFYNMVTHNLGVIECIEKGSGVNVFGDPPRFSVGKLTLNREPIMYASTIVHDACHSKLYSDYLKNNPTTEYVPRHIYGEKTGEEKCLIVQRNALVMLDYPYDTSNFVQGALATKYWEIPYKDRYW